MNINATLLHEIRMIVRQLFPLGAGGGASVFGARRSAAGSELLCVRCLRDKKFIPNKAITIDSGHAVCRDHIL